MTSALTSAIRATAHSLPSRRVGNEELGALLGCAPSWIEERSGIRQRHFITPGESNADLATQAARLALAQAQLGAGDVDALIVATLSPDMAFPGTAVLVQERLGLGPVPALDVRTQCSGFLYALSVAHAWIVAGMYQRVLVIGSEVHSTGLDLSPGGRDVSALFGDGAGAVILEATPREKGKGVLDIRLGADGQGAEVLCCLRPGSRFHPSITPEDLLAGLHYPRMQGRPVFRRAVETLERALGELFADHGLVPHTPGEATSLHELLLVPHQSNRRINEALALRLGLAPHQVVHTIERFANTTAASIPMALDVARQEGRAKDGQLVALAAFGSGYTWGTALLRL